MAIETMSFFSIMLVGIIVLIYSLYPTSLIVKELPLCPTKNKWILLRCLIILFIFGYIVCFFISTKHELTYLDFIVAAIFFFGAFFVLGVCNLTLYTVKDIKRIIILQEENITDKLMGIFNRRYLDRRLEEEFSRAKRYNLPFSILIIDIDCFKSINDEYGHQTGDLVLKDLAKIIKKISRETDLLARYGGDEIVLLLPNTNGSGAKVIGERLVESVKKYGFPKNDKNEINNTLQCTISIGIAELTKKVKSASTPSSIK